MPRNAFAYTDVKSTFHFICQTQQEDFAVVPYWAGQSENSIYEGSNTHVGNISLELFAGRFVKLTSHKSSISLISKTILVWSLLWNGTIQIQNLPRRSRS